MSTKEDKRKLLASIIDFLPLVMFFALNKKYGLINATQALVVLTFISVSISYMLTKKLSFQGLIGSLLVIFFGSLTIFFNNEVFIKIKPTVVNVVFGSILLIGMLIKKNFIKMLLQSTISMKEKGWDITAKLWCCFFFFLAILNEVVWRNFTTDQWVNFKVFGVTAITFMFSAVSLYITFKYIITNANIND